MTKIVELITSMLETHGMTQAQLMSYLGISNTVFSYWKNGKSHSYIQHIPKISEFFGIKPDTLYVICDDEITNKYIVYKHTSPNGKVYIGITRQNALKRWSYGSGYQGNEYFQNAIQKYGWENFTHEILFSNLSEQEAKEKEIKLIQYYDSTNRDKGYNRSPGGDVIAPESTEKAQKTRAARGIAAQESERMKKVWADPVRRQEIIAKMQGKTRSTESKERYRVASLRRGKLSNEAKEKLSIIARTKIGEKSPRSKRVLKINPQTLEIEERYINARQAAFSVGTSINCIAAICRYNATASNKRASHGYFWCYEIDYSESLFSEYKGVDISQSGVIARSGARNSQYGKTISDKQRNAISKAHRKSVRCVDTGKIYLSTIEAAKEVGCSPSAIGKAATGVIKKVKGYTWEYIDNKSN